MITSRIFPSIVLLAHMVWCTSEPANRSNLTPCCLSTNLLADDEVTKCYHPITKYETPPIKRAANITYYVQEDDDIVTQQNGDIIVHLSNGDYFELENGSFCIANVSDHIEDQVLVVWTSEELGIDTVTSAWLHIVSAPFLFFTAFIYCMLPQLRDLQGKSFICFCTVFAIELSILAIVKLRPLEDGTFVTVRGFFLYFVVMSRFLWSNVISIQIFRSVRTHKEKSECVSREFAWYSLYAWGLSVGALACVLVANYAAVGPLAPKFDKYGWFQSRESEWAYLYGPIAVLVLFNCLIFMYAMTLLWQTTFVGSNVLKSIKFKFSMCLRLMMVTSVTWIFEVVNFAWGHFHPLWVVTDILNCIQGLMIFIILVLMRKRALEGLYKRGFCLCCESLLERYLASADDDEARDVINQTLALPLEDRC